MHKTSHKGVGKSPTRNTDAVTQATERVANLIRVAVNTTAVDPIMTTANRDPSPLQNLLIWIKVHTTDGKVIKVKPTAPSTTFGNTKPSDTTIVKVPLDHYLEFKLPYTVNIDFVEVQIGGTWLRALEVFTSANGKGWMLFGWAMPSLINKRIGATRLTVPMKVLHKSYDEVLYTPPAKYWKMRLRNYTSSEENTLAFAEFVVGGVNSLADHRATASTQYEAVPVLVDNRWDIRLVQEATKAATDYLLIRSAQGTQLLPYDPNFSGDVAIPSNFEVVYKYTEAVTPTAIGIGRRYLATDITTMPIASVWFSHDGVDWELYAQEREVVAYTKTTEAGIYSDIYRSNIL